MDANLIALLNPGAALVAGMLTSLHCVGMCTPLACLLIGGKGNAGSKAVVLHYGIYHGGRLFSYISLGALAGAIGAQLVDWVGQTPSRVFPWAMAGFFAIMALGLDKRFFRQGSQGAASRTLMQRIFRLRGETRALFLGLATPLLPCGPLYLFFWVAAASASPVSGAIVLGAFGLGTIPALAASFFGWSQLQTRIKGDSIVWIRRGLAALVVLVLVARSFIDLDFNAVASGEICQ